MEYELYKSYWSDNQTVVVPDVEWADTIELDNEAYQFYILAVIKREDGYYLTTDSGCSCPTPFESHSWPESFTGPLTAEQAKEEVENLLKAASEREYSEGPDEFEAKSLLRNIV